MIFFLWWPLSAFSWNAEGHRIIAQIAYSKLSPHAKHLFNKYNRSLDSVYKPQNIINAAVWLDTLRYQDIFWFSAMHYIDIPFSDDGTPLPPIQDINAILAIDNARRVLLNQYSTDFDKGIALRILLHVVGDIHQPLHAITKVSASHPKGDRGGNLMLLKSNKIAKNLHTYWDRGAGLLIVKKNYRPDSILHRVKIIAKEFPCNSQSHDLRPQQWAKESHALAINTAYTLPINQQYQARAKRITAQRLGLAGCRLAGLLMNIDKAQQEKPALVKAGVG